MFAIVSALLGALVAPFRPRASLVAEILVLRQQLAVLKRRRPRPALRPIDRAFWVLVSRVWSRWADALAIVKPATVIAWRRRGFARFWAYKSRPRGRPSLSAEVIELIERMTRENPTWSRRRIAAELAKLGHDVSKDTAAKYMPKRPGAPRRPPSTTWGTFLRMHLAGTIAIDFLTVPTVTFNVLYVFFVLSLDTRTSFRRSRCAGRTRRPMARACCTSRRPRGRRMSFRLQAVPLPSRPAGSAKGSTGSGSRPEATRRHSRPSPPSASHSTTPPRPPKCSSPSRVRPPAASCTSQALRSKGATVSVDGVAIPLDPAFRFRGDVPAPSGDKRDRSIAVRISHPSHGVHYYLRTIGGA